MTSINRSIRLVGSAIAAVALIGISGAAAQRTGVQVWAQTCGNCHTAQPANRYRADQWGAIIKHMALNARLTTAESDAVLQFLQGGARKIAARPASAPDSDRIGTLMASSTPAVGHFGDPGEDIFKSYCVMCHGDKADGKGPVAAALDPSPANLTDPAFQDARTDSDLTSAITNGKLTMPGFGNQLSADQIAALVSYIRTLRKAQQ